MVDSKYDQDYRDFLNQEGQNPPEHISNFVLNYVKKELDPTIQSIYAKLFFIQALIGLITLVFCPQFSISLTGNEALFHIFHSTFGIYGCMAICGSIFVGSGAIATSVILKRPETRKIHRYNFITFSLVSFLSLLVLSLFGEVLSLSIVLSWLLGAAIGGLSMFELGRCITNKTKINYFYS